MKKGVVIAVVVAIATALGVFGQRHLTKPAPVVAATTNAPPAAPAAPPADAAETAAAPVVPDTLPQFELADRDGKKRKLGEWSGRPLIVNYWATWCGPCRREIPLFNELRTEHKSQKLEIVGIAVDFRDDVLKFAEQTKISYPLLIGEEDGLAAVQAMGVQSDDVGFPFTVFADSRQRIVALKLGELHKDEAELILDRLAQVDAGSLELAAARDQITAGLKDLATKRAAAKPAVAG